MELNFKFTTTCWCSVNCFLNISGTYWLVVNKLLTPNPLLSSNIIRTKTYYFHHIHTQRSNTFIIVTSLYRPSHGSNSINSKRKWHPWFNLMLSWFTPKVSFTTNVIIIVSCYHHYYIFSMSKTNILFPPYPSRPCVCLR